MISCELLEEISKEMKSGVYDFTKNGECSSCGSCCSNFLPISRKEAKVIRRYIEKHKIKERRHVFPFSTFPDMDFTCPFRDNAERKCVIYSVRPAICRDFRCDKPAKNIKSNKSMYHGKYGIVDMRREFFGGKGCD